MLSIGNSDPASKLTHQFKDFIQSSYNHPESRPIVKFIIVMCLYLFLEVLYSILADSMSLMTDAVHMLCDMTAMIIGLVVVYVKKIH